MEFSRKAVRLCPVPAGFGRFVNGLPLVVIKWKKPGVPRARTCRVLVEPGMVQVQVSLA